MTIVQKSCWIFRVISSLLRLLLGFLLGDLVSPCIGLGIHHSLYLTWCQCTVSACGVRGVRGRCRRLEAITLMLNI